MTMFLTCCVRSRMAQTRFGEMRLVGRYRPHRGAVVRSRRAMGAQRRSSPSTRNAPRLATRRSGRICDRMRGLHAPPEPRTTARCFGMGSVRTPPEGLTGKSPNLRRRGPSVMTFSSPGIRRMPGLFTTVSRFAHAAVAGDLRQLVASWRRKFGEIAGTNE